MKTRPPGNHCRPSGTDQQKVLFSQLQQLPHTAMGAAGWTYEGRLGQGHQKMAGNAAERTRLAPMRSVRPSSSSLWRLSGLDPWTRLLRQYPFKQRPRPIDAASSNLVVTEYALPGRRARALHAARDRRFVWPHDVINNDKYAYYTDHFSHVLGRVDSSDRRRPRKCPFRRLRERGAKDVWVAATGAQAIPAAGRTSCNSSPGQCHCRHGQRTVKYDPK